MNLIEEIKKLQTKISKLQIEMSALRERRRDEVRDEVLRLDWLRGKTVMFRENPLAAGIPRYVLTLRAEIPLLKGFVDSSYGGEQRIFGNDDLYQNNIMLGIDRFYNVFSSSVKYFSLSTSNLKTLIEFIKHADLKIALSSRDVTLYKTLLKYRQHEV